MGFFNSLSQNSNKGPVLGVYNNLAECVLVPDLQGLGWLLNICQGKWREVQDTKNPPHGYYIDWGSPFQTMGTMNTR